jgi:short-subunit dehydrogenase
MENDIVMVITGASSGIGRATALEASRRGYNVVLAARRKDALNQLAKECERLGGKALAVPTDVTKKDQVINLAEKAYKKFKKIDLWLNNAAVTLFGRFEETPMEDMEQVINTNVLGYMYGAYASIPYFRKQGRGTLVNVSSMVGVTGQPFTTAYSTSKAAIRGLSMSLEQELSDLEEVHVCTVLPAVIDTPLFNQGANYLGKAVKPPEPIIHAQEVAEEILNLIYKPKKEVTVGNMARMSKIARAIAPEFFDKQFREKILEDHFKDESETPVKGNLYEPYSGKYAQISGGWKEQDDIAPVVPKQNLALAGAAVLGLAIGVVLIFRN